MTRRAMVTSRAPPQDAAEVEEADCTHEEAFALVENPAESDCFILKVSDQTPLGWCPRCGSVSVKRRGKQRWHAPHRGMPHDDIETDSLVVEWRGKTVRLSSMDMDILAKQVDEPRETVTFNAKGIRMRLDR